MSGRRINVGVTRRMSGTVKKSGEIVTHVTGYEAFSDVKMDGHFRCTSSSESGPWTLWFLPDPSCPDEKFQLLEGMTQRVALDALESLLREDNEQQAFRKKRDLGLMRLLRGGEGKSAAPQKGDLS